MKTKHKTSQTLSSEAKIILRQLAEANDMSQSAVLDHLIRHAPEYWWEMKNKSSPGELTQGTQRAIMAKAHALFQVVCAKELSREEALKGWKRLP